MVWPFRRASHHPPKLMRPSTRDSGDAHHVVRPRIETALESALAHGENVVVYGPPHQGKTMLLARQLSPSDSIYIECRPGFRRAQIYRVLLSSLGYAVLVQKKRTGKASATVKLGLGSLA